jgi:hypothetical protein
VRDPSHACGGFVLKVFSRPAPTPYGVETWRDVGWELGSLRRLWNTLQLTKHICSGMNNKQKNVQRSSRRNRRALLKAKSPRAPQGEIAARSPRRNHF